MMHLRIMFVSVFGLSFCALAENDRIKRIRDFHEATAHQRSLELIRTFSLNVEASVAQSESELKTILAVANGLLQRDLNEIYLDYLDVNNQPQITSMEELLAHEERIRLSALRLMQYELELKRATKRFSEERHNLERFREARFCQDGLKSLPVLLNEISYPKFDEINLSAIPKPTIRGVNPVPGQSDDEAEVAIESGTMMASTTTGSAIGGIVGTALIPIPVLGTAIGTGLGAGIGAIFGYCTGKAAVGAKVLSENAEQERQYARAINTERSRQLREIEEARAWLSQHPLTESDIRNKAFAFCDPEKWNNTFETLLANWSITMSKVDEQLKSLAEQLSSKFHQIEVAETRAKEQRKSIGDDLVKKIISKFTTRDADREQKGLKRKILSVHDKVEDYLYLCLTDPRRPCEEKRECLKNSSLQLRDGIKPILENPDLSDELRKFQVDHWSRRVKIYADTVANCAS